LDLQLFAQLLGIRDIRRHDVAVTAEVVGEGVLGFDEAGD